MKRRQFFKSTTILLASVAGVLASVSLLRQIFPRSSYDNKRFKLGKPNQFTINDFTYIPDQKLFVYRDHGGIKVVTAICTHLGCVLGKSTDGFECPCHGSCFDTSGKVLSGAATKDLSWYHLYKDADGQVVVDLKKIEDSDYKLENI